MLANKCTDDCTDRICAALAAGCSFIDAAACGGVSRETLRRWYNAGEVAAEKEESKPKSLTDEDRRMIDFRSAIDQAQSTCGMRMSKILTDEALQKQNWRAAAYWLRCRQPDEWNPNRTASAAPPVGTAAADRDGPRGASPSAQSSSIQSSTKFPVQTALAVYPGAGRVRDIFDGEEHPVFGRYRDYKENKAHLTSENGFAKYVKGPRPPERQDFTGISTVSIIDPDDAWLNYGIKTPDLNGPLPLTRAKPDAEGRIGLARAVAADDAPRVTIMLYAGADPNTTTDDDRDSTVLMLAAEIGSVECVTALINAGADIDAWNVDNATPLMLAAATSVECVNALIQHDATLDAADSENKTALTWAVRSNHVDCATALIAAGADIHTRDSNNWRALEWAASIGSAACVNALLKAGAKVLPYNDDGATAIDIAARGRFPDIVRLLTGAP